jgi:Mn-dependent DtxR family transcriptional regulator
MKGRKRIVDEAMVERIFDMWLDRIPTKAIALELGISYTSVFQALKRLHLVG